MYCPRCGQQVGDETNFCPRCGFYFVLLRDLIATGGEAPSPQDMPQRRPPSERQKGIRLGAQMLFFSIALLPIFFGLSFVADGPAPLLVPLTIFLTGVIWMLYARLFREPDYGVWRGSGAAVGTGRRPAMLPSPADSLSGSSSPPVNTAELMPPSVTEHTTNFLGPK